MFVGSELAEFPVLYSIFVWKEEFTSLRAYGDSTIMLKVVLIHLH